MKFEEDVCQVCSLEDWENVPQDEREGALGVALVRAFLENVRPSFEELSKALELTPKEIEDAEVSYRRLQASGVFSMRFNARRDRCLQGWSSRADGRTAWCHIAAIAAGWIGAGYHIQKPKVKD